jgi:aminoglycoside 6'-N-acetyltransferase I
MLRMIVRKVRPSDAPVWEAMRCDLWPGGAEEHATEIAEFFAGRLEEPCEVLVAEDEFGRLAGVMELSIRDDVAGLLGKRTGYIEGLYVPPNDCWRGIARELVRAARVWARSNECEAFASDRAGRVVIDNRF